MNDFDEYERQGEPQEREKARNWQTAIGMQQVDGLMPSEYLISLARQNIEDEISIQEVKDKLHDYYTAKPPKDGEEHKTLEADTVSAHIAEILSEKTFTFSPAEFIGIHKRLFEGVYSHAGVMRSYNITKSEWVLNGDTIHYASAAILGNALDYDFDKERKFSYKGLTKRQTADHIAEFTTSLWQIHPFCEGNTRTTAVFIIKYLRSLGFKNMSNNLFADNSWYFRNALVRAAATNLAEGVYPDRIYLDRFFGNLLLGESNVLKNRELRVCGIGGSGNGTVKPQVSTVKCTVFSLIKAIPELRQQRLLNKWV
ncbi:MAG: Fic family protein [Christensenellaceae bacterium]|jgi:fido (protein-threonine AMPylation protein)|nr:Fic family protein [Christensenellaceae bacterium]